MFSRENLVSWRAGSCLHEIFGASVGDGLAEGPSTLTAGCTAILVHA